MKTKKKIDVEACDELEEVLAEIKTRYGQGAIMCLGDKPSVDLEVISTGSLLLNKALGVGGYPRGRIIEIYGPESSGKTTLALTAVAEVQKAGGRCAYIDVENTIDPDYSEKIGIEIDKLVVSQPSSGEEAFEIVEALSKSGAFDLIVIDSVAALVPQIELDGVMQDSSVGLQARMMSKALRKISGILAKSNTTLIFINQLREKVGVIYGNNETTTGGRALKFYASIRIDIRRSEAIKEGANIIGNTSVIKIVKNKVAPPFKTVKLDLIYGQGFSKEGELLDLAVDHKIISKSGAWYEFNGDRMGQGRETAKEFLREHKDTFEEVKELVIKAMDEDKEVKEEEPSFDNEKVEEIMNK